MTSALETAASLSLMPPADHPGVRALLDMSFELGRASSTLGGRLPTPTREAIGDLVRSMNCYYSNLIEGHHTFPVEIEKAMRGEYSENAEKRNLQLEARSHIEVQAKIDTGAYDSFGFGQSLIREIHREFYSGLPDEFRLVKDPKREMQIEIIPGEWRTNDVQVGRHVPISYRHVPSFMAHFDAWYNPVKIGPARAAIAAAASHHRLAWIHPFVDGNGRTSRLFAHAYLRHFGIGNELWSVSRGLARRKDDYKNLLERADAPPQTMTDGRGTLSDGRLIDFCRFFIETCIDQVSYMESVIEPTRLRDHLRAFVGAEAAMGLLDERVSYLLDNLAFRGEVPKAEVPRILDLSPQQTHRLLTPLRNRGILVTQGHIQPWQLAFPLSQVERIFPKLFSTSQAAVESKFEPEAVEEGRPGWRM